MLSRAQKKARHSCTLFSLKNDLLLLAAFHLFPHQLQSAFPTKASLLLRRPILAVPERSLPPLGVPTQELVSNFHSRQRERISCLEWKSGQAAASPAQGTKPKRGGNLRQSRGRRRAPPGAAPTPALPSRPVPCRAVPASCARMSPGRVPEGCCEQRARLGRAAGGITVPGTHSPGSTAAPPGPARCRGTRRRSPPQPPVPGSPAAAAAGECSPPGTSPPDCAAAAPRPAAPRGRPELPGLSAAGGSSPAAPAAASGTPARPARPAWPPAARGFAASPPPLRPSPSSEHRVPPPPVPTPAPPRRRPPPGSASSRLGRSAPPPLRLANGPRGARLPPRLPPPRARPPPLRPPRAPRAPRPLPRPPPPPAVAALRLPARAAAGLCRARCAPLEGDGASLLTRKVLVVFPKITRSGSRPSSNPTRLKQKSSAGAVATGRGEMVSNQKRGDLDWI